MSVPFEIRKSIWAWEYARLSFVHCKAACDYVIGHRLSEDDPLYYPLLIGAIVAYGRPFKHSKGIEKVSDAIIPASYRPVHERVLRMRDTCYAHVDVGQIPVPGSELSSDLVFRRELDGK